MEFREERAGEKKLDKDLIVILKGKKRRKMRIFDENFDFNLTE